MICWASLLIFSGIFMGALTKADTSLDKFSQGLGIMLLVYGLLILIGGSQGHRDPLLPLLSANTLEVQPEEQRLVTVTSLKQMQAILSKPQSKPVILDFYADWCASCKALERTTLKDPAVMNALTHFMMIKIDLSANNADSNALLNHYHVVAPPTFIFLNSDGEEFNPLRLVGEVSAAVFYTHLNQAMHD